MRASNAKVSTWKEGGTDIWSSQASPYASSSYVIIKYCKLKHDYSGWRSQLVIVMPPQKVWTPQVFSKNTTKVLKIQFLLDILLTLE